MTKAERDARYRELCRHYFDHQTLAGMVVDSEASLEHKKAHTARLRRALIRLADASESLVSVDPKTDVAHAKDETEFAEAMAYARRILRADA